jgi:UDP-N-acetylglucosamine transferase subunit ALG13
MGHAGRMIPIAEKLLKMNHRIFIGSGQEHLSLFRNELSGITCISFPGFKPEFSTYLPQYMSMLLKMPILIYHVIREHYLLKKIIRKFSIDIVISDNRFGLWNRRVKSVYITHMLRIPFPRPFVSLEPIGILVHKYIINKYSLCFVPDLPGEINISGKLSHNLKTGKNIRYIGILSRFTSAYQGQLHADNGVTEMTAVILSGPGPHKEMLKKKLSGIFRKKGTEAVFLEGRPEEIKEVSVAGRLMFYNHLPSREMMDIISGSRMIISRSGYTTIMELISLNRSAILIPTPGQTEQEYLGEYLTGKGWVTTISEKQLDEETEFPQNAARWPKEIIETSKVLLDRALQELSE